MKLSYILGQLASGELSNLHLAEDGLTINERKLPTVIRRINAGLNDLHTRFLINLEEEEFKAKPDGDEYVITADNFSEITKVTVDGNEARLGSAYRLIRPNVLRFTYSLMPDSVISVEYKASHSELTLEDATNDTNINLPMAYLNALLFFVASKSFTSTTSAMDGDVNESVTWLRKYQDEVSMLIAQGVDVAEDIEQDMFLERGFR